MKALTKQIRRQSRKQSQATQAILRLSCGKTTSSKRNRIKRWSRYLCSESIGATRMRALAEPGYSFARFFNGIIKEAAHTLGIPQELL